MQAALRLRKGLARCLFLQVIWNQAKNYKTTLATVVSYIPVFNTPATLSSILF